MELFADIEIQLSSEIWRAEESVLNFLKLALFSVQKKK